MLIESKNLEFKKEMSDTFLKTVSAFANFGTGTIMFGVDDNGVDIVRFGENISIFLDRVRLNRISIIEQYNKAVEKFVQYYIYEEVEGFYRVKKEKIPEDAFREAIANALINRDWDSVANIQVSFFDDRIEIISPGGLPKGVTEDDYLNKELSLPRNPIIANVFYRIGLIERYGTGVQRIRALYDNSANKPIFKVSENLIKITLPLLGSTTPKTTPRNDNTTPKTTQKKQ